MGFDEVLWVRERVARSADVSPTSILVLYAMASRCRDGNAWPSVSRLAEDTRLSERSVSRCLSELEDAGLMERSTRAGRSTVYRLRVGVTDWHGSKNTPDSVALPPPTACQVTPDSVAPRKERETKLERSDAPPSSRLDQRPAPVGDAGEFQRLEQMALDCGPARLMISNMEADQLHRLYKAHGYSRCAEALKACGGADRPVAMLESRLKGGGKRQGGGHGVSAPAPRLQPGFITRERKP